MESTGALLGGFAAAGDAAPGADQTMKRDQDSTDDFEHLDRETKQDPADSPVHHHRVATQSFLEMERGPAAEHRPPSVAEKLMDHMADKFTDSESDADTAGESPLHRPEPRVELPKPSAPTPEPPMPEAHDPTPVLAPAPAPPVPEKPVEPKVEPAVVPEPKPVPKAEPVKREEVAPPKPEPASQPKPVPVEEKPEPTRGPTAHVIEAEVIFCQMGLVESLIYWRNAARSGAALGAGLALLVALACCSVVSVLAYVSLLALSAAVAFRLYKNVLQAVQKTNDGHPFKWLLEAEVSVSAERAQALAAAATAHLNAALYELRRLFLVEDLVDSLKFGVLLWCLTYVGACFNGITLIILGWIALFTLPKAYEMNKAQVDANLELARAKINEITAKVRAAVPLGRRAEGDKDK
ncbi:reticulon-1 isoform X2 [Bombyx mandarina]|uniref:Reticulon-like protein n=2 Tax=Bombyx TaxID=7090 RepID=A0A8R2LZ32_BOMMO|nr:reticulon-1 isoform X2 [Bombyx mandarina]XP_037870308.1 reticulon-1 isoform X2 [Bombyx mori]